MEVIGAPLLVDRFHLISTFAKTYVLCQATPIKIAGLSGDAAISEMVSFTTF